MRALRVKIRSLFRNAFYMLPGWARPGVRRSVFLLAEMGDALGGTRGRFTPPRGKIYVGSGDFEAIGREFCRYFVDLCGLKPTERVLDIGCGIGRMAAPLTQYLDPAAVYDGFDIVPDGIAWCRKRISSEYPNFRFHLADIYNKVYNPKGRLAAREYRFPYEDGSFDFAFATSVFTHMLAEDVEHYLAEVARVLAPGGRCLITYFLLNDESSSCQAEGNSSQNFDHQIGRSWTVSKRTPETDVAYEEAFVMNLYSKYGFAVTGSIHYGSWCGRQQFLSLQDIVIATRK